ncbi:MAG: AMP-binding protein, partial [Kutzneria sp.]|nr:AMP-binding protein [Kutzneria sp.]
MREFSVPAIAAVAEDENLTDMVWANAERFSTAVSFRRRVGGTWVDVTAREFAAEVTAVAKGFLAAGLERGDRVALMSKTRYEWSLVDFAIWAAGLVCVPVYETSSAEQVEWILADSGARAVVVETAVHRATVTGLLDRLAELRHVWQLERGENATAVDELTELGAEVSDETLSAARKAVLASDAATLIYTSGTTGRPKGCQLTHHNLIAEARASKAAFPELMTPGNAMLMFLPMAHVLARAVALSAVYARCTLGHTP